MTYKRGTSSQFVHQHEGLWCVSKKIANDVYATPERKDMQNYRDIDLIFYHSPRVDIGFVYKDKRHAIATAKKLCEAGILN